MIDVKSLPIVGRAARGKAKGFKIHALTGSNRSGEAWRVAPMNKDEWAMARRLIRDAKIKGYLVGDTGYDSNPLHERCGRKGNLQFLTRREELGKEKPTKK